MKKIIILISLVLFLLVGINVYSQDPLPPVTQGQAQPRKLNSESSTKSNIKTKSNNNIPPHSLPIINEMDTYGSDAATKNSYQPNNDREFSTVKDDPITGYTFLLMIFTGFLVVCNVLLWFSTKKAANAAKKAADALPVVERAYIFITTISLPKIIKENIYEVSIIISNVGKTPAILSQIKSACILSERYPSKHGGIQGEFPRGGAIVPANDRMEIKVKAKITKNDSEKIQAKEIKLLCCGLIAYSDIWKVKHETGFCWEFTPLEFDPCFTLVNDSPLNYYT